MLNVRPREIPGEGGGQGWGVVRRLRYVIKADDFGISRNLQTRFVQDTRHTQRHLVIGDEHGCNRIA
jgi:hypothetical protein